MHMIIHWFKKPVKDSVVLYWELIKLMVPIMIIVRIGVEFGLIETVSKVFIPFMNLVGLPPEAGIIWTTTMLVNIYAGIAILLTLLPEAPMTVAQITILGSLMLFAHGLPVEQRIVQKSGPSLIVTSLLRIVGAMAYGAMLNVIYTGFNLLQEPAVIPWVPETDANADWKEWIIDSTISTLTIYWIILGLIILLKLLDDLKVTDFLSKLLSPILGHMGISNHAIPVTMIGVLLGLSFGGALILREAKEGKMSPKDIFLSLTFICFVHSMIEDTLLILALGADITAILIGRFIFGFIIVFILGRIVANMSDITFNRYLFRQAS